MTIPVPVPVSQFPNATTPLDGTELVPLVKDGVTSRTPSISFAVFGNVLAPEATIAPPAGTLNDVDRLGAAHLFVDTTAGDVIITGFEAPDPAGVVSGVPFLVTNSGANLLTLNSEDAGSTEENQMLGVSDIAIPPGGSQLMYYATTNEKYCLV